MRKIFVVFGTRPEAIKLAPVIWELRRRTPELQCTVCVTGQHREMLDQALALFGIVPDLDLDLMAAGQTPTQVAAAVLSRLEPILRDEKPDWVVVQGDTTTVAAASLAAFLAGVAVAHVEAGLRSGNKWQPFPEEINRRVTSVVADLHFAPTQSARENLLNEGVAERTVLVTGNPVIDALQWVSRQPLDAPTADLLTELGILGGSKASIAEEVDDDRTRTVLVTAHRRENFGAPLESICRALLDLSDRYGAGLRIVYPVHPNPNVRGPVHRLLGGVANIHLVPPLDYFPLVQVLRRSTFVLTDSGGIQEEAPSLGKPVLVLREVTERPEGVAAGTVKLVGTDRARIVRNAARLLDDPTFYQRMANAANPYGDGQASPRIVDALTRFPLEHGVVR